VRKKPRAPVSVPITWDEVDDVTPNGWTMLSLVERVSSTPDPWAAFLDVKQALPKMKKKRR
jgi:bifunctional non-homologous end joining protein LigD